MAFKNYLLFFKKTFLLVLLGLCLYSVNFVQAAPEISFPDSSIQNGSEIERGAVASSTVTVNVSGDGPYYVFTNMDNSLMGWWRGESNANDENGVYNGSWSGSSAYNDTGKFGKSFRFDGTNYVDAGSVSSLQITNSITLSAWVKTASVSGLNQGIISNQWHFNDSGVYFVLREGTTPSVAFSDGSNYDYLDADDSVVRNDGAWHHLATTIYSLDGRTHVKLYADGALVGSKVSDRVNIGYSGAYSTMIGQDSGTLNEFFDGSIDEAMIFSRVLSLSEIKSLYNASVNQYSNSFSDLALGAHHFLSYAIPEIGDYSTTSERSFTVTAYDYGSGTSDDPFQIYTCRQLQNIDINLGAYYELADNIDCSETANWNPDGSGGYYGFDPIGSMNAQENFTSFTGVLDGKNHKISNLYIDRDTSDYFFGYHVGLFSTIDAGAVVKNVGLENVNITGYSYVGALAGSLSGTVSSTYSTGVVTGLDGRVGGLVGSHVPDNSFFNSSPLLFTWNGTKYTYSADIGSMLPRDTDGLDLTKIDSWNLVPKDNKYSIKISEENNEIVYYDELALMTFDHAPGYSVVSPFNRDTSLSDLITVSDSPTNPLLSCFDKFGNNCLDDLKSYDDKWSYKDKSFVNYWIMDFGDLSNKENIQLLIRGARDYAANASGKYGSLRTVEVKDDNGNWVQIYNKQDIGSDGTPRLRAINLSGKFLSDDYHVKVGFDTWNANYFAVDTSPQVPFTANTYYPTKANLAFYGFTAGDKTYFHDHDYYRVSPVPEDLFSNQYGNFTKYGDVLPLLESKDNHFVVMRYGDQMDIEFPYVAPTAGQARSFILYNQALYKHAFINKIGDLGKTVNPLPYAGMKKYDGGYPMTPENIDYLNTWNTRKFEGTLHNDDGGGGSTIIDSYSTANVTGNFTVGGLVGYNEKEIVRSYATGVVACTWNYAGGLVGSNSQGNTIGWIHDSYALGAVSGNNYVGGLAGYNGAKIENSYSVGKVVSQENDVGGLVGDGSLCDDCVTDNSFWNTETSELNYSFAGTGKTTTAMKLESTYSVSQVFESINETWSKISVGAGSILAIRSDGTLWALGKNDYGQLGLGDRFNRNTLIQVGTDNNWADISISSEHALAIKTDGTLWAWGYNTSGQLGLNDYIDRLLPTQIGEGNDWQSIVVANSCSFALKTDGALWSWGYGGYGMLGLGDSSNRLVPTKIGSDTWSQVSSYSLHTVALKTDGTLWSWGYNSYGMLGLGYTSDMIYSPNQIGAGNDWQSISTGFIHSLAIKTDGTLWSWGYGGYYELGLGHANSRYEPAQVGSDSDWKSVSAGEYHSYASKTNNTIWSWGSNWYGQLGLGDYNEKSVPTQVGLENNWQSIRSGDYIIFGLKDDGTIWACGENNNGQLGLFDTTDRATFVNVQRRRLTLGSEGLGQSWDFTNIWNIDTGLNSGYPYLRWQTNVPSEDIYYTLTYTTDSNGSITGQSSQRLVAGVTGSSVTAMPNTGYRFVKWNEDDSTLVVRTDIANANRTFTAIFERISTGGGAVPVAPTGIGTGVVDKVIPMGQAGTIGTITTAGVNYLSYIGSDAGFDTVVSHDNTTENHNLIINNLNLFSNIIEFTLQSTPQKVKLKLGETAQVDLDGDKIKDVEVKFVNVWVNRAELTIKSLLGIKEVKAEKQTSSVVPTILPVSKYIFKRNLTTGATGADVKELQKYLNANGYIVAKAGQPGSVGFETSLFGSATRTALVKFQKAVKIKPAVGYFGPVTRGIVNGK